MKWMMYSKDAVDVRTFVLMLPQACNKESSVKVVHEVIELLGSSEWRCHSLLEVPLPADAKSTENVECPLFAVLTKSAGGTCQRMQWKMVQSSSIIQRVTGIKVHDNIHHPFIIIGT
jgi:hypothetical protein